MNPFMIPKSFFLYLLFALLVSVTASSELIAQGSLTASNLSDVRASEVTEAELQRFVGRAQAQGVTINQALQVAQLRGLPASEAAILRERIIGMQRGSREETTDSESFEESRADTAMADMERSDIEKLDQESDRMRRTFGTSVFHTEIGELTPPQNIPTPTTYILGPGDQLSVTVWGDQTASIGLTLDAEGTVFFNNLGPLMLSGQTLQDAEELIRVKLRQQFAGMRAGDGEQTTFARVTLNQIRSIQIAITGDVVNPGSYTMSSGSTVFNALYRAGGPAKGGSFRKIRLIRDNQVASETDLYDFLVEGIQSGNLSLRDGDVLHIMPYQNRVEVVGEARRGDMFFETVEGETLADLLHFAGGFSENAHAGQVRIHRNTATERRILTVGADEYEQTLIQNGDVIFIEELLDRFINRVSVRGAVWRSGDYEMRAGMTLLDLIEDAGGLRPDALITRGLVNRLRTDFTLEQISFDVAALLENPAQYNIVLRADDVVWIRSIHNLTDRETVEINGAIRNSGTYAFREHMTLEDLILKADGFRDGASESRIEVSRRASFEGETTGRSNITAEVFTFSVDRNLSISEDGARFELQPFDRVQVFRRPDFREQITVTIEGEVLYPGTYTISSRNERISDIIRRAGGVTSEAYLPGSRLTRKLSAFDREAAELNVIMPFQFGQFGSLNDDDSRQQQANRRESSSRPAEVNRSRGESERTTPEQRVSLNQMNRLEATSQERGSEDEEVRRIGLDLEQILRRPGISEDLFVRDGDVIRVPEKVQTVAILGAVMQDVEVRYIEGQGFSYYISRAGGFSEQARKNRAYVVYANGDVDRRKSYLFGLIKSNPSIEPGAQIVIPEKLPGMGLTPGEIISLTSSATTTALLILTLIDRLGD
ncbi:MAG: hypothetical protein EA360_11285 [Balneolaceae bacterium]|nr:MAG: hypothetical protein EA360_11285 [Balneolaceae bacterium]